MIHPLADQALALQLFFADEVFVLPNENTSNVSPSEVMELAEKQSESALISEPAVPYVSAESPAVPVMPVPAAMPEETPQPVSFMGENAQHILILVQDAEHAVSTDAGKALLRNVVQAVQLSGKDFALVNLAAYPQLSYKALKAQFQPVKVLSFGVTAKQLEIPYDEALEIQQLEQTRFIFTMALDVLDKDLPEKKRLWKNLKQL